MRDWFTIWIITRKWTNRCSWRSHSSISRQLSLDKHIYPGIAIGLRARGIEVTTTFDVHLSGQDDLVQRKFYRRDSRVIVTHDDDLVKARFSRCRSNTSHRSETTSHCRF